VADHADYLDLHDRALRDHREWQHCYCLSFIATPAEWDMLTAVSCALCERVGFTPVAVNGGLAIMRLVLIP